MQDSVEPDGSQPLTNTRQELFCQYLSAGESRVDAYKKAGYKDSQYAGNNCQHLWDKDYVQLRYTYLMARIAAKIHEKATNVTKESISLELGAAIFKSTEMGQMSAVVSALGLRAKLYGLVTDKVETKDIPPELTKAEEEYHRQYAAWRLEQEAVKARQSIRQAG